MPAGAETFAMDAVPSDDGSGEEELEGGEQEPPTGEGHYATLGTEGPQSSAGSTGHPDGCMPCTFYCFTRRGCNRGADCRFCHLSHQSKLQQRRETWKKQQREKRKLIRERVAIEGQSRKGSDKNADSERGQGLSPSNQRNRQQSGSGSMSPNKQSQRSGDAKFPDGAAVFSYTPKHLLMTLGQEVEFSPRVQVSARQFRLRTTLPQGLSLDPVSGIISGAPTASAPKASVVVEADLVDDRLVRTQLELEVIDFTRGGFVVGHMSEIEPGRYMLLMHVPEDGQVQRGGDNFWPRFR